MKATHDDSDDSGEYFESTQNVAVNLRALSPASTQKPFASSSTPSPPVFRPLRKTTSHRIRLSKDMNETDNKVTTKLEPVVLAGSSKESGSKGADVPEQTKSTGLYEWKRDFHFSTSQARISTPHDLHPAQENRKHNQSIVPDGMSRGNHLALSTNSVPTQSKKDSLSHNISIFSSSTIVPTGDASSPTVSTAKKSTTRAPLVSIPSFTMAPPPEYAHQFANLPHPSGDTYQNASTHSSPERDSNVVQKKSAMDFAQIQSTLGKIDEQAEVNMSVRQKTPPKATQKATKSVTFLRDPVSPPMMDPLDRNTQSRQTLIPNIPWHTGDARLKEGSKVPMPRIDSNLSSLKMNHNEDIEGMNRFLQTENELLKAEVEKLSKGKEMPLQTGHAYFSSPSSTIPYDKGQNFSTETINQFHLPDYSYPLVENSAVTVEQQQRYIQDAKSRIMLLHQTLLDLQLGIQSIPAEKYSNAPELAKMVTSSIFYVRQIRSSTDGIWSNIRVVQASLDDLNQSNKKIALENSILQEKLSEQKVEMQAFMDEQELLVSAYQDVMNRDYEQIRSLSSQLASFGLSVRSETRSLLSSGHGKKEAENTFDLIPVVTDDMINIRDIDSILGESSDTFAPRRDVARNTGRRAELVVNYIRKKVTEVLCQMELKGGTQRMQFLAERDEIVRQLQSKTEKVEDESEMLKSHVFANLKNKLENLQKIVFAFETIREKMEERARADAQEIQSLKEYMTQLELQVTFLKNSGMQAMDADRRKLLSLLYERDCELAEKESALTRMNRWTLAGTEHNAFNTSYSSLRDM